MAEILVATTAADDRHLTPAGHPEDPRRLTAVLDALQAPEIAEAVRVMEAGPAPREALEAIHPAGHLDRLEAFCATGGGRLDPDTGVSTGSYDTAVRAAGALLEVIDALERGEADHGLAAVRPPGHHALASTAMGFCLVNSVAVAAASLAARGHRVAIVDWDVHHGNGTQDLFYDRGDVLYVSTHQAPHYPGTGRASEVGVGDGFGASVNVPLPAGSGGEVLRSAFDRVVVPAVQEFQPDWLLVSAGFDAHRDDPLASLALVEGDFAALASRLTGLVAPRRLAFVLEGGYDLGALGRSVLATLAQLVGAEVPDLERLSDDRVGVDVVDRAIGEREAALA